VLEREAQESAAHAPKIRVSPNPAHTVLYIDFMPLSGSAYQIFNCYGALALQGYLNEERAVLDITGLPAGGYYLRVTYGPKTVQTVKFTVIR